jgi:hypothetical protein
MVAPAALAQSSGTTTTQSSSRNWPALHDNGAISPETTTSPLLNPGPADPNQAHMMREMAKQREILRQKEIVEDTNHLLDLAKQLKDAVDKSSRDQLSLDVVNTADKIEKLAKSVKQKMRDGE